MHESLATAWPRFLEWLEQIRERQQGRLRLRAAADQWQAQGRKAGALWGGPVLVLALEDARRLQAAGESLDDLEREFLDASRALDRRRRLTRWGIGILLVLLCVLAVWFFQQSRTAAARAEAAAARAVAEEEKLRNLELEVEGRLKEQKKLAAELESTHWQLNEAGRLAMKDWDTAGAFLWSVKGWDSVQRSGEVLGRNESDSLKESYLLRLGLARRQLPTLIDMAYQENLENLAAAAHTPDGAVVLTAGMDATGGTSRPLAQVWRRDDTATWKASALPWGKEVPGQHLRVSGAYLDPGGQVAVVIVHNPLGKQQGVAHVWSLGPRDATYQGAFPYTGWIRNDGAAISPDGRYFAAVTRSPVEPDFPHEGLPEGPAAGSPPKERSRLLVWKLRSGGAPLSLREPEKPVALGYVAFNPGGVTDRVAVAVESARDSTVCLEWSLEPNGPTAGPKPYRLPSVPVSGPGDRTVVAYGPAAPDHQLLVVARGRESDRQASAWVFRAKTAGNRPDADPVLWSPHRGPISHIAFSREGDRLATASTDGTVVLWTFAADRDRTPVPSPGRILSPRGEVFQVEFSPDGQYVATAGRDRRALVWDVDSGQLAHPSLHHSGSVTRAGFTPDGRHVITVSRHAVYRWGLGQRELRPLQLEVSHQVQSAVTDVEGRSVLAWGERRSGPSRPGAAGWARVWDAGTGAPRTPELLHTAGVRHAAISPAGPELVSTVTSDGRVWLWDIRTGRQLPSDDLGRAVSTAFGHDGKDLHLLILTRDDPEGSPGRSDLHVLTLGPKGETVRKGTTQHPFPFTAAAFSPRCDRVVAYTGDAADNRGIAVIWDLGSGRSTELKGQNGATAHKQPITHAAFSPDGTRLVTTSRDDSAWVWSLPRGTGTELHGRDREDSGARKADTIQSHTADVVFAAFDRSGSRIVTASSDRSAIAWVWSDAESRYKPVTVMLHDLPVEQAIFGHDTGNVLTATRDGTTQLWDPMGGLVATKRFPGQVLQILSPRQESGKTRRVFVLGSPSSGGPDRPPYRGPGPSGAFRLTMGEWDLTPDQAPRRDEYRVISEILAARQVAAVGHITQLAPLDQKEVHLRWLESIRQSYAGVGPQTESNSGPWHEREAAWHLMAGRWEAALRHLDQVFQQPLPQDRLPHLLAQRAKAYEKLKRWKEAEQDLSDALEGRELDGGLLRARADVRRHLGKDAEAIEDYRKAAEAFAKAIPLNPTDVPLARDRAESLIQLKDWDEAAKDYQAIIRLEPKVLSHRLRLAAIYLQPISPGKEVRPERLEEARRCLAEAVKDFPEESTAWLHLAVVQLAAGKTGAYQATRAHMLKAFKPLSAETANTVAWAAAFAKDTPGGAEGAVKLAERAVAISSRDADYLRTYGAVLYRAGKREEAISQLQSAMKQRPQMYGPPDQEAYDNAFDRLFMAMAAYTPKQPEQARKTLRSAVETVESLKAAQQSESPDQSLTRVWTRLQFEVLRREAAGLIGKP